MRGPVIGRRGPLFWISAVAGWALIGWGVRGILHFHIDTRPPELARFFFAGLFGHDLVFAPIVLAGGVVLSRLGRGQGRWRAYVQAAVVICGSLVIFAYPEVRDYARVLHNPTSLPHNYTFDLAVVIIAVCIGLAGLGLMRTRFRRSGARSSTLAPDGSRGSDGG